MGDYKTIVATVRYSDLEGGFWYLEADSVRYVPETLPAEFQVDGMKVKVTLKIRKNWAGIHMFGIFVEIIEIRKVNG